MAFWNRKKQEKQTMQEPVVTEAPAGEQTAPAREPAGEQLVSANYDTRAEEEPASEQITPANHDTGAVAEPAETTADATDTTSGPTETAAEAANTVSSTTVEREMTAAEKMHAAEASKSFFGKLGERLGAAFGMERDLDEDFYEEIEEILITSDIGMETTENLMQVMRLAEQYDHVKSIKKMKQVLQQALAIRIDKGERQRLTTKTPLIILMIGINGGGKTTTIGKLSHKFLQEGKSVLLVAGDTFRAAAGEQLSIWAERAGVPLVSHGEGADPSAVLYDGLASAKARGTDIVICDTAGRLQNKKNLMAELEKMNRIIDKQYPEAARETLLVLDATTGKNAISQVEQFNEVTDLSGVIITKLDGTAKGGIAITIADEKDVPIKYIGVGEKMEDLQEFDPEAFIAGIFQ